MAKVMPKVMVLTLDSSVTCGHQGTAAIESEAKLTVKGKAVLLKSGIEGKSITGCKTPEQKDQSGTTGQPCASVGTVSAGASTKLKVGGQPVMLDTLGGTTNGMVGKVTPQVSLTSDANQTKLTAI